MGIEAIYTVAASMDLPAVLKKTESPPRWTARVHGGIMSLEMALAVDRIRSGLPPRL